MSSTPTETEPYPVDPDVDAAAVRIWLDQTDLPGRGSPLEFGSLAGGSQNVIVSIRRDGLDAVLRMPPPGAPADRDRGMEREWRFLSALEGTDVPHPAALARCEDASVLGRPFFLMTRVDGWAPTSQHLRWPAPFADDLEARRELAFQLVEGGAELSRVDWRERGLTDLGRPEGFHERQVERWTSFFRRLDGRSVPGFDEAAAWLTAHRPIDYIPGIMHGDFSLSNVMFGNDKPGTLAAIIDWEMSTIGDPKLDLAWALHNWPTDSLDPIQAARDDGYLAGMPNRQELTDRYAQVSGRQVDDLDYYLVLAKWKLAVVLEQSFQRAGDDERLALFGPIVLSLMAEAAELAETSSF